MVAHAETEYLYHFQQDVIVIVDARPDTESKPPTSRSGSWCGGQTGPVRHRRFLEVTKTLQRDIKTKHLINAREKIFFFYSPSNIGSGSPVGSTQNASFAPSEIMAPPCRMWHTSAQYEGDYG